MAYLNRSSWKGKRRGKHDRLMKHERLREDEEKRLRWERQNDSRPPVNPSRNRRVTDS